MLKRASVLLLVITAATMATSAAASKTAASHRLLSADQIQASGLTATQAKQVLVLVLRHEKLFIKKPGFNIEHIDYAPGYVSFQVTYDAPDAGATSVIGAFAVSPRTGDVWEVNLCKRYDFPSLKRIQAEITQRTHTTLASEAVERRSIGCADQ